MECYSLFLCSFLYVCSDVELKHENSMLFKRYSFWEIKEMKVLRCVYRYTIF